jgi:hypothetical protein
MTSVDVELGLTALADFVLGDAASPSKGSNTPPTWVGIFDIVAGLLLVAWVVHAVRRPRDPKRIAAAIERG